MNKKEPCGMCPWTVRGKPDVTPVSMRAACQGAWFVCVDDFGYCTGAENYTDGKKKRKTKEERESLTCADTNRLGAAVRRAADKGLAVADETRLGGED